MQEGNSLGGCKLDIQVEPALATRCVSNHWNGILGWTMAFSDFDRPFHSPPSVPIAGPALPTYLLTRV